MSQKKYFMHNADSQIDKWHKPIAKRVRELRKGDSILTKLYTIGSAYSLLIALLLYGFEDNAVYVFNGYVVSERIIENLSKFQFVYVRKRISSSKLIIGKTFSGILESYRYQRWLRKNVHRDTVVIGHDHLLAVSYPLWGKYSVIIEDGYLNGLEYDEILRISNAKGVIRYKILNQLFKVKNGGKSYKMYGFAPSINRLFLTQSRCSKEIRDKVAVVSIRDLWNSQRKDVQGRIKSIFLDGNMKIKQKSSLLLTQPLSEDKLISEDEKVKIYSGLIKQKDNLIIKPHPREKTRWDKVFPDAQILPCDIPVELISVVCDSFERVYTCFSTAVNCFQGVSSICYISMRKYPEIMKTYRLEELYDSGVEILELE